MPVHKTVPNKALQIVMSLDMHIALPHLHYHQSSAKCSFPIWFSKILQLGRRMCMCSTWKIKLEMIVFRFLKSYKILENRCSKHYTLAIKTLTVFSFLSFFLECVQSCPDPIIIINNNNKNTHVGEERIVPFNLFGVFGDSTVLSNRATFVKLPLVRTEGGCGHWKLRLLLLIIIHGDTLLTRTHCTEGALHVIIPAERSKRSERSRIQLSHAWCGRG